MPAPLLRGAHGFAGAGRIGRTPASLVAHCGSGREPDAVVCFPSAHVGDAVIGPLYEHHERRMAEHERDVYDPVPHSHVVPAGYLRSWARGKQIAMRRVGVSGSQVIGIRDAGVRKGRHLSTANAFVVANADTQWFHEPDVDPWMARGHRPPLGAELLAGYGLSEARTSQRRAKALDLGNAEVRRDLSNDPVQIVREDALPARTERP